MGGVIWDLAESTCTSTSAQPFLSYSYPSFMADIPLVALQNDSLGIPSLRERCLGVEAGLNCGSRPRR